MSGYGAYHMSFCTDLSDKENLRQAEKVQKVQSTKTLMVISPMDWSTHLQEKHMQPIHNPT